MPGRRAASQNAQGRESVPRTATPGLAGAPRPVAQSAAPQCPQRFCQRQSPVKDMPSARLQEYALEKLQTQKDPHSPAVCGPARSSPATPALQDNRSKSRAQRLGKQNPAAVHKGENLLLTLEGLTVGRRALQVAVHQMSRALGMIL